MTNAARIEATITEIAKRHLRIPTLDARGLDRLDFHDCGVRDIRTALLAAFGAGAALGATFGEGVVAVVRGLAATP
jgi:hypothetical protein